MHAHDRVFVREGPLVGRVVRDQALIVNCTDNSWTRLNPTATYIFEELAQPRTVPELARAVQRHFACTDELEADVADFVAELRTRNLVRDVADAPRARARLDVDAWRDQMDASGADLRVPTWAKIEISTTCHLDCVHCYIPGVERRPQRASEAADREPQLTDDEIRATIDQLADLGTVLLTFTGGEIFLRRSMFDVLRYAHDRGFVLELFTSATPLKPEKIAELAELNVARVQVSVYSHEEAVHDAVTQRRGTWKRSMDSVRAMVDAGLRVDLACSLMPGNFRDALALTELAESLGATCSYGYPISARTDGNTDVHAQRLSADELNEAIELVPEFFALPRAKGSDERICPAGVNMCSITASGDVLPCSQFQLPAGNVRHGKLRDAWENSPVLQRVRGLRTRDLKPSALGEFDRYVGLCPGLNLLEEGDFLRPAGITAETTRAVAAVVADPATSERTRRALTEPGPGRQRAESG